jgi:hypothetical protein
VPSAEPQPSEQTIDDSGAPSRPVLPAPRRGHAAPPPPITLTESAVDLPRVPRPEDVPVPAVTLPQDDPAATPRAMHPASSARVIRRAPASAAKPLSIVLPDTGPGTGPGAAAATVTRRRRGSAPGRPDLTVLTGSADPGPPGVKRYRTGATSLVDDAIRIAWQSAGTGAALGRHRKP